MPIDNISDYFLSPGEFDGINLDETVENADWTKGHADFPEEVLEDASKLRTYIRTVLDMSVTKFKELPVYRRNKDRYRAFVEL